MALLKAYRLPSLLFILGGLLSAVLVLVLVAERRAVSAELEAILVDLKGLEPGNRRAKLLLVGLSRRAGG
jgi:hypothetical protein